MKEIEDVTYRTKDFLLKISKSICFMISTPHGWDFPGYPFRIPGIIHNGFIRCLWRISINTPDQMTPNTPPL